MRRAAPVSPFPAVARDLNFVVDEGTSWSRLHETCQRVAGDLLREVLYQETYRDAKKDGSGKKRLLLTLHFQSLERTLKSEEVDVQVEKVVAACHQDFGASLLA